MQNFIPCVCPQPPYFIPSVQIFGLRMHFKTATSNRQKIVWVSGWDSEWRIHITQLLMETAVLTNIFNLTPVKYVVYMLIAILVFCNAHLAPLFLIKIHDGGRGEAKFRAVDHFTGSTLNTLTCTFLRMLLVACVAFSLCYFYNIVWSLKNIKQRA